MFSERIYFYSMKRLLAFVLILCMGLAFVPCGCAEMTGSGAEESDEAFERIIEELSENWSVPKAI